MKAKKSGHIINVSPVAGHKVRAGGFGCRYQARGSRDLRGSRDTCCSNGRRRRSARSRATSCAGTSLRPTPT
jgi:hypothetical protein